MRILAYSMRILPNPKNNLKKFQSKLFIQTQGPDTIVKITIFYNFLEIKNPKKHNFYKKNRRSHDFYDF